MEFCFSVSDFLCLTCFPSCKRVPHIQQQMVGTQPGFPKEGGGQAGAQDPLPDSEVGTVQPLLIYKIPDYFFPPKTSSLKKFFLFLFFWPHMWDLSSLTRV